MTPANRPEEEGAVPLAEDIKRQKLRHLIERRWTEDSARAALAAQNASGVSVAAFAARERLDPQRLYFWRRRLGNSAEPSESATFIEVRPAATRELVETALRSGHVIRVAESIDGGILRRPVDALEECRDC